MLHRTRTEARKLFEAPEESTTGNVLGNGFIMLCPTDEGFSFGGEYVFRPAKVSARRMEMGDLATTSGEFSPLRIADRVS